MIAGIKMRYAQLFTERKSRKILRSRAGNIFFTCLLSIVGIFMALPMVYAVVNAFKPINELFLFPPRYFVKNPTLENFALVGDLTSNLWVPLSRYIFNSVFISCFGTFMYVIIAALCAYPLSKHRFKGRSLIVTVVVWAILFRPEVTGISQYMIIAKLGLINTYSAILFPSLAGSFGVFLLKQFIETIPNAIIESARIDGANEYRIMWSIIMPAMKPAWVTLVIFTFNGFWNSSGAAYIYDESMKMLPAVLGQISTGSIARAGAGSAVALLLMLPPRII